MTLTLITIGIGFILLVILIGIIHWLAKVTTIANDDFVIPFCSFLLFVFVVIGICLSLYCERKISKYICKDHQIYIKNPDSEYYEEDSIHKWYCNCAKSNKKKIVIDGYIYEKFTKDEITGEMIYERKERAEAK